MADDVCERDSSHPKEAQQHDRSERRIARDGIDFCNVETNERDGRWQKVPIIYDCDEHSNR